MTGFKAFFIVVVAIDVDMLSDACIIGTSELTLPSGIIPNSTDSDSNLCSFPLSSVRITHLRIVILLSAFDGLFLTY